MTSNCQSKSELRVAWLLPSLALGFYWQPVLREFSKIFPRTIVFTGRWPGFVCGCENSFRVRVVGQTRILKTSITSAGYQRGIVLPPFRVVPKLLRFKPHVIFSSSYTLWTILALLLKPCEGWRIVIVYEGKVPLVDAKEARVKLLARRVFSRYVDAFITNSREGKKYFINVLGAKESKVFSRPFEVPDILTLFANPESSTFRFQEMQRPIFLSIGQIIPRKGVHFLLEACSILQRQGYRSFTLLIVGDGPQRRGLEESAKIRGLQDRVKWEGWVDYSKLGSYFQHADVFVFPTLADVWGMVVLEAMTFGKPILCSKWAGTVEMVVESENGFVFDPYQPKELAELMKRFIDNPKLIHTLGNCSKHIIRRHNPGTTAKHLAGVLQFVLSEKGCHHEP